MAALRTTISCARAAGYIRDCEASSRELIDADAQPLPALPTALVVARLFFSSFLELSSGGLQNGRKMQSSGSPPRCLPMYDLVGTELRNVTALEG